MAAIKVFCQAHPFLGEDLRGKAYDTDVIYHEPNAVGYPVPYDKCYALLRWPEYEQMQAEIEKLKSVIRGKTFYCEGCAGEIEQVRAAFKAEIERLKNE